MPILIPILGSLTGLWVFWIAAAEAGSLVDRPWLLIPVTLSVVGSGIDLYCQRLPNWLTATVFLSAVVVHAGLSLADAPALSWLGLVVGTALGFILSFIFFILGGTSAGDVKLLAALGAWVGAYGIISTFFWMAIFGGVFACVLLISKRLLRQQIRGQWMPYGPAITAGLIVYVLWPRGLIVLTGGS